MEREIKIFKSFEEQEMYFLHYFFLLSPSDRLKKLSELQKKNYQGFLDPQIKQIAIHKSLPDGY